MSTDPRPVCSVHNKWATCYCENEPKAVYRCDDCCDHVTQRPCTLLPSKEAELVKKRKLEALGDAELRWVLKARERGRTDPTPDGKPRYSYIEKFWGASFKPTGDPMEAFEFKSKSAAFRSVRRLRKFFQAPDIDFKVFRRTR